MLEIKNVQIFNDNKTNLPEQIEVIFDMKSSSHFNELWQIVEKDLIMSQSTVHSLKKLVNGEYDPFNEYVLPETKAIVKDLFERWEESKKLNDKKAEYEAYEKLSQNIPCGIELWVTVVTNYKKLAEILQMQKPNTAYTEEWEAFTEWCYSLPGFCEN